MKSSKIIGTRASILALAQAQEVKNLLKHPDIEIKTILTSGDKIKDRSLAEIGGKGLFVKEIEEALIAKTIDIAVHSTKDLPPDLDPRTSIAAFLKRINPHDCFLSKNYRSIAELPKSAIVGTSSPRRKAFLLMLRPDLKVINFRGNVDTRLKKIALSEVDAAVLARCGLERIKDKIGQHELFQEIIPIETILPATGQGALAIQIRKDDESVLSLVKNIDDYETRICVEAERKFLKEIGASCLTPVAAFCELENHKKKLRLRTIILDRDGSDFFRTEFESDDFSAESAKALAIKAAQTTKLKASKLLRRII